MASKGFFNTPIFRGHKEAYFPPLTNGGHAVQVMTGPALMVLALGLQIAKKNMTGKSASEFYQHVVKFLAKAEARDKVGRMVQYFCRFLSGALQHLPAAFPLQAYKPVISEVQTTLAWARRTHRWFKELPHIPALADAIQSLDVLEVAQRSILITFLIQDHIYWLLKVGILKFQNYTPVQWHRRNLRFITLSHVLGFSICIRAILRIQEKQARNDPQYAGSEQALQKAGKDVYDQKRQMVRYVLTFIQMLHVSQVKVMDDWYIGLMGVASAYIDASKQW